MGRQGGQGKGKPKLKDRHLGKSLIKQLQNPGHSKDGNNMISILDNSALDDYIISAEMDENDVEVVRVHNFDAYLTEPTIRKFQTMKSGDQFNHEHLQIPRKPAWSKDMTAEEVDRREKNSFLAWRRHVALLENKETLRKVTPYEKNIEVWRQLWRVLERSDISIQVVDARNPLLYYTKDLSSYAASLTPPRSVLLLINKADFLSENQRRLWSMYFLSNGISFIFYSAHNEQEKIDNGIIEPNLFDDTEKSQVQSIAESILANWKLYRHNSLYSVVDNGINEEVIETVPVNDTNINDTFYENDEESDIASVADISNDYHFGDEFTYECGTEKYIQNGDFIEFRNLNQHENEAKYSKVLSRVELIELLGMLSKKLGIVGQRKHDGRYCIGMVGYPNVGKSSVINTLLCVSKSNHGAVRVAVSSTPGKTKHFQTLIVNDEILLCDCPGLVFPSFMSNTGEMLCAGILPINQMRDHIEPASVIAYKVPMHLLNATYGCHIKKELDFKDNQDRPPTASEFLSAYCSVKGYVTSGTGRWDEFRACKDILRDFNDGKILYSCPPPYCDVDIDDWLRDTENIMATKGRVAERLALQRLKEIDELDTNNSQEDLASDEMVFGKTDYCRYDDESDSDVSNDKMEIHSVANAETSNLVDGRREHKRLKHWGKKGKKLRDKNPYGEENGVVSYVAYSTNRSSIGIDKGSIEKVKRKNPRKEYGTPFVRPTLPHHVNLKLPKSELLP